MKYLLSILLVVSAESSIARTPGYCASMAGDDLKYCLALVIPNKDACSEIVSEEKKYTCHARLRYDQNICGVIEDKTGQKRCLELVRKDERLRKRYAIQSVYEVPPEWRDQSGLRPEMGQRK